MIAEQVRSWLIARGEGMQDLRGQATGNVAESAVPAVVIGNEARAATGQDAGTDGTTVRGWTNSRTPPLSLEIRRQPFEDDGLAVRRNGRCPAGTRSPER